MGVGETRRGQLSCLEPKELLPFRVVELGTVQQPLLRGSSGVRASGVGTKRVDATCKQFWKDQAVGAGGNHEELEQQGVESGPAESLEYK